MAVPEPGSVAHHALTGTLAVREDGPEPGHVLAGYPVPPGTLLEVRLAPTTSEPTGQEPDWLPVRYEAPSPVGLWATWLLAVETPFGPREVDLRLPPDAVLRWPPQAPVIDLGKADYARLAALADQLERSFAALDGVHEDPRSAFSLSPGICSGRRAPPGPAWPACRGRGPSSGGGCRRRIWSCWRGWPRTWSGRWRCSVSRGAAAPRTAPERSSSTRAGSCCSRPAGCATCAGE